MAKPGVSINFDKSSGRALIGNLTKAYYQGRVAGGVGMVKIARRVINHSKTMVPVDTGALKASAYVESANYGKEVVSVDFGYCGEDGRYAQINPKTGVPTSEYVMEQHENLYYKHPTGGEAKFLEKAITQVEQDWKQDLARTIWGAYKAMSFRLR